MLEQNDKLFCFDSALETADEALDYCDGCVDCSKTLPYNLLKDEFNSSRTLEHLHDVLCEKLANFFDEAVARCQKMHIFENNGFRYTYGFAHDSLQERALSFPEHMCVLVLNK